MRGSARRLAVSIVAATVAAVTLASRAQRSAWDRCMMYSGEVLYGTSWQGAGRYSWGNCG